MSRSFIALLAVILAGCGGSSTAGTGGSSGSGGGGMGGVGANGGSGGGGAGGAVQTSGDCSSDAECAPGKCVELSPGGYRVCQLPVEEATSCGSAGIDECCNSSDCTSGKCIEAPLTPFCGGAQPQPYNACAVDMCQSDVECSREGQKVCIPAGALGYKVAGCMGASCLLDSDCTAEAEGACILLKDPCCGAPTGLVCSYPTGGCKKDSDCPNGGYCAGELDSTTGTYVAKCHDGPIACPA